MPLTQSELADGLESLYDSWSDRTDVNPAEARKVFAEEQARLFFEAMIGRETSVTGVTSEGKTVSGTGTILD